MENPKMEISKEQIYNILNKYLFKKEHEKEIKNGREKLKKLQKHMMNALEELWCDYLTAESNKDIVNMNAYKEQIELKQIELRETIYKLFGPNNYEEYVKMALNV